MKFAMKITSAAILLASATGAMAQKGETVKIAWLDPLSGLMAAVGTNQLKSFQFIAEEFNKKNAAGVKFEIIGIDNKLSPQETTSAPVSYTHLDVYKRQYWWWDKAIGVANAKIEIL